MWNAASKGKGREGDQDPTQMASDRSTRTLHMLRAWRDREGVFGIRPACVLSWVVHRVCYHMVVSYGGAKEGS